MLLKEIVVKLTPNRMHFSLEDSGAWCQDGTLKILTRFFYVPGNVKKLWIQFHNRTATQRVKCQVKQYKQYDDKDDIFPFIEVGSYKIDQGAIDPFIKELVGKTVYVEVWYED